MIIRTCVPPKKVATAPVVETKSAEKIQDEEVVVKPVNKAVKKRKATPVYEPVVEEKSEVEELKPWLEDDIED